jgi:hypothetical protein
LFVRWKSSVFQNGSAESLYRTIPAFLKYIKHFSSRLFSYLTRCNKK